jgi:dTDP-glucose 4,6-dehydratase
VKVLVTGADGFIGSHLCEELLRRGSDVIAVDIKHRPVNLKDIRKDIVYVELDVTDLAEMERAMQDVDVVFHMAAQGCVHLSRKNPFDTISTNVMGSLNVVEAARKIGTLDVLIYPGSDKEYGELRSHSFVEDDPISSINSAYDVSKIASDRLFLCYHLNYGVPTAVLRFSNVYGPRQSYRNVVPEFVREALTNGAITVKRSGPTTRIVRDFVFISDIVNALMLTAEKKEKTIGQAINIGTGIGTSIESLAEIIVRLVNPTGSVRCTEDAVLDIQREIVNWHKALEILEWSPKTKLEDGLRQTIDWFRSQLQVGWAERVAE